MSAKWKIIALLTSKCTGQGLGLPVEEGRCGFLVKTRADIQQCPYHADTLPKDGHLTTMGLSTAQQLPLLPFASQILPFPPSLERLMTGREELLNNLQS